MHRNIIPYGKQNIVKSDLNAVNKVLKGDFLTQGPAISDFEKQFSSYIGCKFSVAVANGTAALHLAALALGINKGDKVITTPITFVASANCIRYCEGDVVFSDIDPSTYLIDLVKVEELLLKHPKGTFKGIIPVDFSGRAVNLEELKKLANKYDLWILEDACHSPGGYFIDSEGIKQNCGNGKFADISIFSFHPVKHIATGEGGMITTNNEVLYNKLIKLRSHGIIRDSSCFVNKINFATGEENENLYPGWYMEMRTLGFNYRLTDFQAALGTSQLKRASDGLEKRKKIAKKYFSAFQNCKFIINQSGIIEGHAYHLYIIEVKDRVGLYNFLRKNGIHAQVHYIPCHLMPYYRNLGWKDGDFNHAESYYKKCLSLPIYPSLKLKDVNFVIKVIKQFYA